MSLRYKTEKAVLSQQTILDYLLLRLKELENEVKMYRRVVSGGGLTKSAAIAAVEGEATLDLTGVIPDSAYPNAVLKDGTRAMTDNLDIGDGRTKEGLQFGDINIYDSGSNYAAVRNRADNGWLGLRAGEISAVTGWGAIGTEAYFRTRSHNDGLINFNSYATGWKTVAIIQLGLLDIPRAGDITMLDQKMMQFGTYTDAQRPAAGTAGRWIFNTDDGMPNYDDGTDWRDINGNIT